MPPTSVEVWLAGGRDKGLSASDSSSKWLVGGIAGLKQEWMLVFRDNSLSLQ